MRLCGSIVSFISALVFGIGGACIYVLLPGYIHDVIRQTLIMDSPTASTFDSFANTSSKTSVYQSFYVFHCTNPYDVLTNGAAPNLVERGPYNYLTTQWRDTDNISWRANATVEYTYHETYTFEGGLSGSLTESDVITTLDLGFVGALYRARASQLEIDALKVLIDVSPSKPSLFINLTVRDLLFGYNNTFLQELKALGMVNDASVVLFEQDDPSTWSAPSAMYTGGKAGTGIAAPPTNSMNQMTMWRAMPTLPYWGSSYANMINGTDGTSLPPGVTCGDQPHVFVDTLYRSVRLLCQETTSYEGVDLLRFVLHPDDTQSAAINPNNAAFFMAESGFLPTPPAGNAPLVFSKPHYLDANLSNVKVQITPASITRELYETFLDTEPNTGVLFRVHKRIQLNVFVQSWYNAPSGASLQPTWFPILWADENTALPMNLVSTFKKDVMLPLMLAKYGGIALMAFGGVLVALAVVCFACCGRSKSDPSHHIAHTPSEIYAERLNLLQESN